MNSETEIVEHIENIQDGEVVSVYTYGDHYKNVVCAGCCCEGKQVCLLLVASGKITVKQRYFSIPLRDISRITREVQQESEDDCGNVEYKDE